MDFYSIIFVDGIVLCIVDVVFSTVVNAIVSGVLIIVFSISVPVVFNSSFFILIHPESDWTQILLLSSVG